MSNNEQNIVDSFIKQYTQPIIKNKPTFLKNNVSAKKTVT